MRIPCAAVTRGQQGPHPPAPSPAIAALSDAGPDQPSMNREGLSQRAGFILLGPVDQVMNGGGIARYRATYPR